MTPPSGSMTPEQLMRLLQSMGRQNNINAPNIVENAQHTYEGHAMRKEFQELESAIEGLKASMADVRINAHKVVDEFNGAASAAEEIKKLAKQTNDYYEWQLKNLEGVAHTLEEEKELAQLKTYQMQAQATLYREAINSLKKKRDEELFSAKTQAEANKIIAKYKGEITSLQGELKKVNREMLNFKEATDDAYKSIHDLGEGFNRALRQPSVYLKDIAKDMGNFAQTKLDAFSPKSILEFTGKLNDTEAAFAKATGWGFQFQKQVGENQAAMWEYGVTTADAYKAHQDLAMGMNNFTHLTKEQQESLVEQSEILGKLGQDYGATAKNVNTLKSVLGQTREGAIKTQKDLAVQAKALGMSVNQINESFTSNMNRLAIYGNNAQSQFERMSALAKATNLELGTMVDLNERLSTFEGAGEFAGRMNAMTGQDLFDVTELVGREGADKTMYIIDKLKQSGLDTNDPKLMRAAAGAAGIGADQLNSYMKMDEAELGKTLGEMDKKKSMTDVQKDEEVKKNAKQSTTSDEKLLAAQEKTQRAQADLIGSQDKLRSSMDTLAAGIAKLGSVGGFGAGALGMFTQQMGGLGQIGQLGVGALRGTFRVLRGMKPKGTGAGSGEFGGSPGGKGGGKGKGGLLGSLAKELTNNPCVSICDESLQKLARLIRGGGGSGGVGDIVDMAESLSGKRKGKKRRPTKVSKSARTESAARRRELKNKATGRNPRAPNRPPKRTPKGKPGKLGGAGAVLGLAGGISNLVTSAQQGDVGGMLSAGAEIGGSAKESYNLAKSAYANTGSSALGNWFKGTSFGGRLSGLGARAMRMMPTGGILERGAKMLRGLPFGKILGFIGPLIEAWNSYSDVKDIAKTYQEGGMSKADASKQAGQLIFKGLGGILGGIGGTMAGGLLTPFIGPFGPMLGSYLGGKAGNWLFEIIGGIKDIDKSLGSWAIDKLTGVAPAQAGENSNVKKIDTKDGMIAPGGRYMTTGAGELLSVSPTDTMFAVDLQAAKSGGGKDNLTAAVMELVKAIKGAQKEVVLQIDGREIRRVAFSEFLPRAT